jgi:ABC-type branched-subunit amino acid transport system ATPase component
MATSQTAAKAARAGTRPGTYFLSLTVENVRCFGPAQTLDLSDGHGHHAPWTVILGENGLGKTTLLTCIACFAEVEFFARGMFRLPAWHVRRQSLVRGSEGSREKE